MTEQEWLECEDPEPLLMYLRDRGSDRKLRLFAVACAGFVRHLLEAECSRELLGLVERWADEPELAPAVARARAANNQVIRTFPPYSAAEIATEAVSYVAGEGAWAGAWQVLAEASRCLRPRRRGPVQSVRGQQIALLRHIFGNPFAPVPFHSAWRTPAALAIAQAAYEDRRWDDFPFLADALEEAGCSDRDILAHCREPGEHVRGCWALDLILGRG